MRATLALALTSVFAGAALGHPPVASYVFPAGGQRGTAVAVKVGGLFLHEECGFAVVGPGVTGPATLKRVDTLWFEGPILPLPDSQRQEDYPKDMGGRLTIAPDAALGPRGLRVWTSQGAASGPQFVVGDLPEVVEDEVDGEPLPVRVTLPVTVNGRIFPREDVDLWAFRAKKGETIVCEARGARFGSPLDARLEILDASGKVLMESSGASEPTLRFVAPADGEYRARIRDSQFQGGQAYVYRLTLTRGPDLRGAFPLGGPRGGAVKIEADGQTFSVAIPKDAPSPWLASLAPGRTLTLDVDDLPERTDPAQPFVAPAVLNGRIGQPGRTDVWTLDAKKGQALTFELRAASLGSSLDGVAQIVDATGKTLAKFDAEKAFAWTPPTDGPVRIEVRDRFRSRGGPAFAYRLRVAPTAAPDFRVTFASDAISVLRKGQTKVKLAVERIGDFKDTLAVRVDGLPAGVKATPLAIKPGQATADLTLSAEADTPISTGLVTIVAVADKAKTERIATGPRGPECFVAVGLPTPFVIKGEYDMGFAPRGAVHMRKYKIERNGYDGPIVVGLADRQARHLQGVVGPTIVVPAGVSEFTYEAFLPPWMETGRTCRVCVMGVGTVTEGGVAHRVAFSSVNQNEQLVAVVGPGLLALELGRTSGTATANRTLEVPVRIKRGVGLTGPVRVEATLPRGQKGVSAEAAVIAPDREEGVVVLRFAASVPGPLSAPVTIRATLTREGRPVVAEAPFDLQPE